MGEELLIIASIFSLVKSSSPILKASEYHFFWLSGYVIISVIKLDNKYKNVFYPLE